MQYASIGSIVLEFEERGSGEPVVMIHGSMIADTFRTLIEELRLANFRLITYHRRGYVGSTPLAAPLSIGEQAADCLGLLRYLSVDRAHVVGHSFGGAVALQMATDSPDVVGSLALLEPALMVGESGPSYRAALEQGIERFREGDPAAVLESFLEARWPAYRDRLEEAIPGAISQAVADATTTFEYELPGLLAWEFTTKEASAIEQPVLAVLGGESERLWPRFGEVQRWLLASLPNVEGFVLPNATHFLQVENPPAMAEALASFLQRNSFAS